MLARIEMPECGAFHGCDPESAARKGANCEGYNRVGL